MKVQVIVLVDVDADCVEKPANMTEERHREVTAKAVECTVATVLDKHFDNDKNLEVDFIAAAPVLENTDPFFAT